VTTAATFRSLLLDAHRGSFPPVDGGWTRIAPWRSGLGAVIAFTGHAVMAVDDDVEDHDLAELGVDGYGGAHDPRVVLALAGAAGWIDSLDAVLLCAPPTSLACTLVERPDLAGHPRAQLATKVRDDVRVFGHPDVGDQSLVTVARGAGRAHRARHRDRRPSRRGPAAPGGRDAGASGRARGRVGRARQRPSPARLPQCRLPARRERPAIPTLLRPAALKSVAQAGQLATCSSPNARVTTSRTTGSSPGRSARRSSASATKSDAGEGASRARRCSGRLLARCWTSGALHPAYGVRAAFFPGAGRAERCTRHSVLGSAPWLGPFAAWPCSPQAAMPPASPQPWEG